jgi:hypothetical protein
MSLSIELMGENMFGRCRMIIGEARRITGLAGIWPTSISPLQYHIPILPQDGQGVGSTAIVEVK